MWQLFGVWTSRREAFLSESPLYKSTFPIKGGWGVREKEREREEKKNSDIDRFPLTINQGRFFKSYSPLVFFHVNYVLPCSFPLRFVTDFCCLTYCFCWKCSLYLHALQFSIMYTQSTPQNWTGILSREPVVHTGIQLWTTPRRESSRCSQLCGELKSRSHSALKETHHNSTEKALREKRPKSFWQSTEVSNQVFYTMLKFSHFLPKAVVS